MNFTDNCISTDKAYLSNNAKLSDKIKSFFTICGSVNPTETIETTNEIETESSEPSDSFDCPIKSENAVDISEITKVEDNMILYGRNKEIKLRLSGSKYSLFIYKCEFISITVSTGTAKGGAIYISISGTTSICINSTICYCTFKECECPNGGSIAIENSFIISYHEIIKCTFNNNKATGK